MGASKYETPVELWMKYIGMRPPEEFNEAMRLGLDLEDYVKTRFTEHTGREVRDVPFQRMKGADHVGGHADGELIPDPRDIVPIKEIL
jgi:predicted phage-related endonuclease